MQNEILAVMDRFKSAVSSGDWPATAALVDSDCALYEPVARRCAPGKQRAVATSIVIRLYSIGHLCGSLACREAIVRLARRL